jgi:hypothetical protein
MAEPNRGAVHSDSRRITVGLADHRVLNHRIRLRMRVFARTRRYPTLHGGFVGLPSFSARGASDL